MLRAAAPFSGVGYRYGPAEQRRHYPARHIRTAHRLLVRCCDLILVTVPACAEDRVMPILYKLFTLQADICVSALNSMLRHNGFIGRDGEA